MEKTQKKPSVRRAFAVHALLFYTIWALFEFFAKPFLEDHIPPGIGIQLLKSGVIKNLVWTLPAMLLVHYFHDDVYVELKEMFTTKVKWVRFLPVFALFTAFILINEFVTTGTLKVNSNFVTEMLIPLIFVGITEEMVFRGWMLNATLKEDKKSQCIAIGINSVMFTMIHFPTWIMHREFVGNITHFRFITIIILSVIFSVSFVKSKNILVPVLLHMCWDLWGFMFF